MYHRVKGKLPRSRRALRGCSTAAPGGMWHRNANGTSRKKGDGPHGPRGLRCVPSPGRGLGLARQEPCASGQGCGEAVQVLHPGDPRGRGPCASQDGGVQQLHSLGQSPHSQLAGALSDEVNQKQETASSSSSTRPPTATLFRRPALGWACQACTPTNFDMAAPPTIWQANSANTKLSRRGVGGERTVRSTRCQHGLSPTAASAKPKLRML